MNGNVSKVVGRLAHSLRTAEELGAARTDDAQTQTMVGVVYSMAGSHNMALPHFERAALLAPSSGDYAFNLGMAQQNVGDMEGAARSFARAVELAPDAVKPAYALTYLRKQTPENQRINALERLFSLPDPQGMNALHAGHALAKTYEDLGAYDMSFAWLTKAKAKRGSLRRYSPHNERAVLAAAMLLAKSDAEGFPSDEPVFVVGLPRTGTTLVDRILSSHSDVMSAGELSNFPQIMKAMTGTPSRLALDVETLQRADGLDLTALGRSYVDSTRPITGRTRRFVDKAPMNYLLSGLILRALPDARIVCMARDPMDTCLSLYKQMFATEHPYFDYVYDLVSTARAFVLFDEAVKHLSSRLRPDRFAVFRYEDFVDDLEGQTRRLLAFCGLPWDERCLAFHENESPVATPSSTQVRQPIYRTSIGRWRAYGSLLDPAKRVLLEAGLFAE